jgi:hypothetical protein
MFSDLVQSDGRLPPPCVLRPKKPPSRWSLVLQPLRVDVL